MEVQCPHCGGSAPWQGNPSRPFCSPRCRALDLGDWASERYRLPVEEESPGDGPALPSPPEEDGK